MQTIGIDMAKDTFHAAFDDRNVMKFANTAAGIEEFMTTIEESDFTITDTRIGVEATGVYHLLFAVTLREHSWDVVVINPLESHRMITQGLRTVKTDRLDALKIRTMAGMGKGYLFTDTKDVLALKALVVERQALVDMRKMTKQRMEVHRLKEAATGLALQDSFTAVMEVIRQEIKHIEHAMREYEPETQELLRSIPGVGSATTAALVAFIGDIDRVCHAGETCRLYRSGLPRLSKRHLRTRQRIYFQARQQLSAPHAVQCRLHRPAIQSGAKALSRTEAQGG